MEFQNVREISPTTYTFTLTPTHVTYANTLRRLMMTGVETVAFRADMTSTGTTTDVTIRENTTPMTNEMLAHRIGLLPIAVTDPMRWNPDRYSFNLSVTGDRDEPKDIFASDIVVTERIPTEDEPVRVPTERFFPPHPITRETCLIATLYPGETQKLEFSAKATIGTGRENARFQPTSQCSYEYTRDSDPERREELFTKWLVAAKKASPDALDKESDQYQTFLREFNTMEVARCYLRDDAGEPYSFDFAVESVGPLSVEYIVRRACEVGEAMVAKYVNIHTGDLPEDIVVSPSNSRVLGFDFLIRGHDHTLGNMLQTYLVNNHMGTGGEGKTVVTYAGYIVPHPLRDEMLLRIGVEDGSEKTARKAFAEACRGCAQIFGQMKSAWMRATGREPAGGAGAAAGQTITVRRKTPRAGAGAGAAGASAVNALAQTAQRLATQPSAVNRLTAAAQRIAEAKADE
jgi:DNA-directed RNA polymerase subunit D